MYKINSDKDFALWWALLCFIVYLVMCFIFSPLPMIPILFCSIGWFLYGILDENNP
jgi:hypothetical protein